MTIFDLLCHVSNSLKDHVISVLISAYIEQIEFKKEENDEYNLESVSYILKNSLLSSNFKKSYERYSKLFCH